MGKLPGFTFYPGDWMKDPELRRCTREARSVWIDMICLMFECEERGVLSTGGRPWSLREVAGALSGDERTNLRRVGELLRNGVAKRRKDGAVFSKRLVRDDQERQQTKSRVASFRGKKPSNATCNASVTPKYVNEDEDVKDSPKEERFELPIWVPEKAWLAFIQMRTQKKEAPTELAKKRLVMKLEDLMNEGNNPEMVIWESVMNGWKGFFALKNRDIGKARAATIPQERPTW